MRRAFFPNLDAERELATPGPYQPTGAVLGHIRRQGSRLEALALAERLLDVESPERPSDGVELALSWCPTAFARNSLQDAGWRQPRAPGMAVLRQVNDRRFLVEEFVADEALERTWVGPGDDLRWLRTTPDACFRLKRRFGFAGRGQRTLSANPSPDDLRFIADSQRHGFLRERQCEIVAEWSLHGVVDETECLLGKPCRQWCDRFGSAIRHEPDAAFEHRGMLHESAERVAERLRAAGYFGPFGIDAFSYRWRDEVRFNPLSDLNARFTMGWSIGMGSRREQALERMSRE